MVPVQGLGALLQSANPLSGVLTAPSVVPPVSMHTSSQGTALQGSQAQSSTADWLQQVPIFTSLSISRSWP